MLSSIVDRLRLWEPSGNMSFVSEGCLSLSKQKRPLPGMTWQITLPDFSAFLCHRITEDDTSHTGGFCENSPGRNFNMLKVIKVDVSSSINWIIEQHPTERTVTSHLSASQQSNRALCNLGLINQNLEGAQGTTLTFFLCQPFRDLCICVPAPRRSPCKQLYMYTQLIFQ